MGPEYHLPAQNWVAVQCCQHSCYYVSVVAVTNDYKTGGHGKNTKFTHTHTHIHTRTYAYTHRHTRARTHTNTCTYTCAHRCTCTRTHAHVQVHKQAHTHTNTCIHARMHIHAHEHIQMHTLAHTHMKAYTCNAHTQTHAHTGTHMFTCTHTHAYSPTVPEVGILSAGYIPSGGARRGSFPCFFSLLEATCTLPPQGWRHSSLQALSISAFTATSPSASDPPASLLQRPLC